MQGKTRPRCTHAEQSSLVRGRTYEQPGKPACRWRGLRLLFKLAFSAEEEFLICFRWSHPRGFQTESSLQFAEVSYCLIGLLFSEQVWMMSTSLGNHWSLWFQFQEKDDVRFDTIRLIVNKIYAPTSPMRFALRNSQLALVGRQYAHRTRACARNETACSERWW